MQEQKLTPMLHQYHQIKKQYKDMLLLFRLGDFYELFYDDAVIASKELGLTLTSRHEGVPMCGVPYFSVENYISKLIKRGFKLALCDQVEDPKLAKTIVKREVVQIFTPGTLTNLTMLNSKLNNYLASINIIDDRIGISFIDISTAEFFATEVSEISELANEIIKFKPSEFIVSEKVYNNDKILKILKGENNTLVTKYNDWVFEPQYARQTLLSHFKTKTLKGFGCDDKISIISSAGAIISYITETQKSILPHINDFKFYEKNEFMVLNSATIKALELVNNLSDGTSENTLLKCIDYTQTPMGSRQLRSRILQPLLNIEKIKERQKQVEFYFENNIERERVRQILKNIQDIERLIARISLKKANARDLIALKNSLIECKKIKDILNLSELEDLSDITELINRAILDDPSPNFDEGNLIKSGYNEELDKYRKVSSESKDWILQFQMEERERLKINSLKIKYNNIFGYFIEVTKPNLHLVPSDYIRKQTISNAERFTCQKLQEYESIILNAKEKAIELEYKLFLEIRNKIETQIYRIQKTAKTIGEIDVSSALAELAKNRNYTMPEVNNTDKIIIKDGRHPVVEAFFTEERFIPNDTQLDADENRLLIITGPNMAGKSTYLRQVCLIVLLAQIGSYVPATEAKIGIVDKIFTRVGASDRITSGESTFLVEMHETANILHNATNRSLIIMDEIGRGTSTYDGLSIAWAVAEFIFNKIGAKTLFATHYHEMTQLGNRKGIKNYNILVKEWNDEVIFLRKLAEGSADKSYGIQVAKLAGIPIEVINRAKTILMDLENNNFRERITKKSEKDENQDFNLLLFK